MISLSTEAIPNIHVHTATSIMRKNIYKVISSQRIISQQYHYVECSHK